MSGTALDHPLVRDYLRGLDAAMRGLPAAQARELREQITTHLDDALPPDASDQEVAATLSRLGVPADLAAEASSASGAARPAPSTRRVRWRSERLPAQKVIEVYTDNVIDVADQFSAAVGVGISDTRLQGTDASLAALLQVGNAESLQRAILYAALSAQPPELSPFDLADLQQAAAPQSADFNNFNVSADLAEQQLFTNTVAGATVDNADKEETTAEVAATAHPLTPLTANGGMTAATWYGDHAPGAAAAHPGSAAPHAAQAVRKRSAGNKRHPRPCAS